MTTIQDIIELAARLPSGLNDSRAVEKLRNEHFELLEALNADDRIGALLEAADVTYYAAKSIQYAASLLDLTVEDVMEAARLKYELRARPGNPKSDGEERQAVRRILGEEVIRMSEEHHVLGTCPECNDIVPATEVVSDDGTTATYECAVCGETWEEYSQE